MLFELNLQAFSRGNNPHSGGAVSAWSERNVTCGLPSPHACGLNNTVCANESRELHSNQSDASAWRAKLH